MFTLHYNPTCFYIHNNVFVKCHKIHMEVSCKVFCSNLSVVHWEPTCWQRSKDVLGARGRTGTGGRVKPEKISDHIRQNRPTNKLSSLMYVGTGKYVQLLKYWCVFLFGELLSHDLVLVRFCARPEWTCNHLEWFFAPPVCKQSSIDVQAIISWMWSTLVPTSQALSCQ